MRKCVLTVSLFPRVDTEHTGCSEHALLPSLPSTWRTWRPVHSKDEPPGAWCVFMPRANKCPWPSLRNRFMSCDLFCPQRSYWPRMGGVCTVLPEVWVNSCSCRLSGSPFDIIFAILHYPEFKKPWHEVRSSLLLGILGKFWYFENVTYFSVLKMY